jgi:UDP-galactopyranose mutase
MTRAARDRRVFYVEEPVLESAATPLTGGAPRLERVTRDGLTVVRPHLPTGLDGRTSNALLAELIAELHSEDSIVSPVHWFYTPMSWPWTAQLEPSTIVYDCMDELSAFLHAPARLVELEAELLDAADVVFTGGYSLYEAKRKRHPSVHAFPSGVDVEHFARARLRPPEPVDQAGIGRPRIGFFGVIDERIDLELLDGIAAARPSWQLVLIGPVAKIPSEKLPRRANIHYLGQQPYEALPAYLAGWDVAIMPFARNAATRYISPTKTPEYLAGGRPVVSTPIHDVVASYGRAGLVRIADGVDAFVVAIERALAEDPPAAWPEIDAYLSKRTWDEIWARMAEIVDDAARLAAA